MNFGRELHRVEMAPCSRRSRVGSWALGFTFRAAESATSVGKFNGDLDSGEIEIDIDDFPVVAESKKLSVVCVEIVHPHKIQKHRH